MSVITDNRHATNDTDLRELNVNEFEILNKLKETIDSVCVRHTEFEISTEIIRAANATAYTTNQIINSNGTTTLPEFNFSGMGAVANIAIQINSVSILSSYGDAPKKLSPIIHLFNSNSLTGQSVTDASDFNPTYEELKNKRVATLANPTIATNHGSGFYILTETEILRNCRLDSTGKIYLALINTGGYTPASGEKLLITLKGYLM